MPHYETVIEELTDCNAEAVLFDGLNDALIGVAHRFGQPSVALYDYDLCIESFRSQGMSYEESCEWMDFNVIGAYIGESTPVFATCLPPLRTDTEEPSKSVKDTGNPREDQNER